MEGRKGPGEGWNCLVPPTWRRPRLVQRALLAPWRDNRCSMLDPLPCVCPGWDVSRATVPFPPFRAPPAHVMTFGPV